MGKSRYEDRQKYLHLCIRLQRGYCGICGERLPEDPKDIVLDHIYPLGRGGTGDLWNVHAVHPVCDMVKKDRILTTPEEARKNKRKYCSSYDIRKARLEKEGYVCKANGCRGIPEDSYLGLCKFHQDLMWTRPRTFDVGHDSGRRTRRKWDNKVVLNFDSHDTGMDFIARVEKQRPGLRRRLRMMKSQLDIVVNVRHESERQWLHRQAAVLV